MIEELKIKDFLDALSSSKPTPGGGAASALVASIAASLVCKVSVLTIGKKNYQDVQDEVKQIYERAKELKERLLRLAERDSEAFNKIIEAYRSAKGVLDQKEKQRMIEEASKDACSVPLETADASYQILELSLKISKIGNKNAYTDGLTAAYLAHSAINGALENVFFNLKNIFTDQKFLSETREKAIKIRELSDELYSRLRNVEESGKGWS